MNEHLTFVIVELLWRLKKIKSVDFFHTRNKRTDGQTFVFLELLLQLKFAITIPNKTRLKLQCGNVVNLEWIKKTIRIEKRII